MKYIAIALVACTTLACNLVANMELDDKASGSWDGSATVILVVLFVMALAAHATDK